jgi:hypothetical protein
MANDGNKGGGGGGNKPGTGGGGGGGGGGGTPGQKPGPNWPSKEPHQPSGPKRDNNPPKK